MQQQEDLTQRNKGEQNVFSLSLLHLLSSVVSQVASPAGQLANSAPLEQTPAEEESRKSISRSFKGTMASSTERRKPFSSLDSRVSLEFFTPCSVFSPQSGFLFSV